jgi:hypothetical protein
MKIPVCPLTVTHVIIITIKKERRFHFVITTAYDCIGLSSPSFWCTPTPGAFGASSANNEEEEEVIVVAALL